MKASVVHRSFSSAAAVKKYTEDHEAVVFDDSTGIGVISITNYAQESLGDVVFVELPALETKVSKGGQQFPQPPDESRRHLIPVILPLKPPSTALPRRYAWNSRPDWRGRECQGCV